MSSQSLKHQLNHLAWPFFDDTHREYATRLSEWAATYIQPLPHGGESDNSILDKHCRSLVESLGSSGWLKAAVPKQYGGLTDTLDVRTLCLSREILGAQDGLADFAFAMQGLGSGPISLFGSEDLKATYLPRIAAGKSIAAFAISESEAGSDVSAMTTTARFENGKYIIDGEKTWISNAGIADHYIVFCRLIDDGFMGNRAGKEASATGGAGKDGNSNSKPAFIALLVNTDNPGLTVSARIDVIAPHPLGTITFNNCVVDPSHVVGEPNKGLRVALGTLDVFRTTVAAASLGFASRALREAVKRTTERSAYGQSLSDFQMTRARLASMATDVETSSLLIYKAAWNKDSGAARITKDAAMAKWHATEAAQRVIDSAVQLFGGSGVVSGSITEHLYREIRSLRIYEGTSEIQQLIIADQVLAEHKDPKPDWRSR